MKVAASCAGGCRSGHRDLGGEPDWALVMGIGSRSGSRRRELGQEAPEVCPAGAKPSPETRGASTVRLFGATRDTDPSRGSSRVLLPLLAEPSRQRGLLQPRGPL